MGEDWQATVLAQLLMISTQPTAISLLTAQHHSCATQLSHSHSQYFKYSKPFDSPPTATISVTTSFQVLTFASLLTGRLSWRLGVLYYQCHLSPPRSNGPNAPIPTPLSLPFPFCSLSFSSLLTPILFPLMQLGSMGCAVSSYCGSGQSPANKQFLVYYAQTGHFLSNIFSTLIQLHQLITLQ